MSILKFPDRRRKPARSCRGCGERLPLQAPAHWSLCRKCYGYHQFRRALDEFARAVRS